MEINQGDLADIVRASGRSIGTSPTDLAVADWQASSEGMIFQPSPIAPTDDFGDPLVNFRGPLLDELAGTTLANGPDPTASFIKMSVDGGGCAGGGNDGSFSQVIHVLPGGAQVSPLLPSAVKPYPANIGEMTKAHGGSVESSSPQTPGVKQRKCQARRVICIPAPAATGSSSGEVVPSDLWAWRKYGQKPIKGSPYPRGYYRCSSSKGCSARKQVERSRTDPNMLVITYTSEHNHTWPTQGNALAGSARSQLPKSSPSTSKNCPNGTPPTSLKQEFKETRGSSIPMVKENVVGMEKPSSASSQHGFNQVFNQELNIPVISEMDEWDNLFPDLRELELDDMQLIFSRGSLGNRSDHEESKNKAMNTSSFFDCTGSSFGEAKRGP